jgi:hypothetical protein
MAVYSDLLHKYLSNSAVPAFLLTMVGMGVGNDDDAGDDDNYSGRDGVVVGCV